jgi:hypothetical protein
MSAAADHQPAATSAFWKGKVGSNGYVLCLGPTH